VGDIALDSISADNGTDFDITLADNQANALEIKEAGNSYLNFATTNSSELITGIKKRHVRDNPLPELIDEST
jgi:hypothetical protein